MPASTIPTPNGQKSQPWKKNWPPQDSATADVQMTPEQLDLQRSYGTHASNTKGRIFEIDNKPQSECFEGRS